MRKIFIYGFAIMLICVNQAYATSLTNGSFELGLTGWTSTPFSGGEIITTGTQGTSDGALAANFNGGNKLGGTLSQSFSTIIGAVYQLDFDYGVFVAPGHTALNQSLQVEVLGTGILLTNTVTDLASNPTTFNSSSFSFTADSLSTNLVFSDFTSLAGSFAVDSLLDNVSVTQTSAPATVPEPSTMLLLGTGLAGLVGWQYRKKQVK